MNSTGSHKHDAGLQLAEENTTSFFVMSFFGGTRVFAEKHQMSSCCSPRAGFWSHRAAQTSTHLSAVVGW